METPKKITQQQIIDELPGLLNSLNDDERAAVLARVNGVFNEDVRATESPIAFEAAMRRKVAAVARRAIDEVVLPVATNGRLRDIVRLQSQLRHVFSSPEPKE